MSKLEVPIFQADLMRLLGITHAGTLLKQIKGLEKYLFMRCSRGFAYIVPTIVPTLAAGIRLG